MELIKELSVENILKSLGSFKFECFKNGILSPKFVGEYDSAWKNLFLEYFGGDSNIFSESNVLTDWKTTTDKPLFYLNPKYQSIELDKMIHIDIHWFYGNTIVKYLDNGSVITDKRFHTLFKFIVENMWKLKSLQINDSWVNTKVLVNGLYGAISSNKSVIKFNDSIENSNFIVRESLKIVKPFCDYSNCVFICSDTIYIDTEDKLGITIDEIKEYFNIHKYNITMIECCGYFQDRFKYRTKDVNGKEFSSMRNKK